MKTIKQHLLTLAATLGLVTLAALSPLAQVPASAQISDGLEAASTSETRARSISSSGGVVQRAVNLLLWIVGIVSVIFIIWGGFRYITSAGDSSKVTAAKNTVLYAVVGLVIAIFSYAIAQFVFSNVQ